MAEGKSEAMARQLDAAQAISHVGSWEWDLVIYQITIAPFEELKELPGGLGQNVGLESR